MEADQAVVDDFNASQDAIQLILAPMVGDVNDLNDALASGEAPDIFGPFGVRSFGAIQTDWMDLDPLVKAAGFDLTQFHPALVNMYRTDKGLMSLPFSVYPSTVFYNRNLFDEADLSYPPAKYGEWYTMPNGSKVEWTWDAVRDVARLLTLDTAGRNAVESGFDRSSIRQYGFTWEFEDHPAYWGSYWAGGGMVAAGGSPWSYRAQVPDAWRAAWRWTYDGIWGDMPFMGNAEAESRTPGGNPFDSGKVAMTVQPYWYTCCINHMPDWDTAAMPTYNGKVGGRIDGETFRIWKGTKHPQEAFTALAYLAGEGVRKLIIGSESMPAVIEGMPARTADQKEWLDIQKEEFPRVKNWDVILAGLNYPDVPSAETSMPNHNEAWSRGITFDVLLRGTGGLDLDKEIDIYLNDLTTIFNQ